MPSPQTRVVGADQLTDAEAEAVAQAIDIYAASPTSPLSFHTVPMRNQAGRLYEVRFFADGELQHPLSVIRVSDDGALAPIDDLP
jgi:hypothetical protein